MKIFKTTLKMLYEYGPWYILLHVEGIIFLTNFLTLNDCFGNKFRFLWNDFKRPTAKTKKGKPIFIVFVQHSTY